MSSPPPIQIVLFPNAELGSAIKANRQSSEKAVAECDTIDERFAALRATMDADRAAMKATMDADRADNMAVKTYLANMQLPVVGAHIVRYVLGVDAFRKSSVSDCIGRIPRSDKTLKAFAALKNMSTEDLAVALDGVISERNGVAHPATAARLDRMVCNLHTILTPAACAEYPFEWSLVEQYELLKKLPGVAQRFQ